MLETYLHTRKLITNLEKIDCSTPNPYTSATTARQNLQDTQDDANRMVWLWSEASLLVRKPWHEQHRPDDDRHERWIDLDVEAITIIDGGSSAKFCFATVNDFWRNDFQRWPYESKPCYLDNLLMTLIRAPFSSFNRWLSAFNSDLALSEFWKIITRYTVLKWNLVC